MSEAARARLSARNKESQVWKLARNTGAKTPEGRKRISQNAVKDGARGVGMVALAAWCASLRKLLKTIDAGQGQERT